MAAIIASRTPAQETIGAKLRRLARQARFNNPVVNGLLPSPPATPFAQQSFHFSGLTQQVYADAANPRFVRLGQYPRAFHASIPTALATLNTVRDVIATDAPTIELYTRGNGATFHNFNVIVDGRYVTLTPQSVALGQSTGMTSIPLGSRKLRIIEIESYGLIVYGFQVGPTDTVFAPDLGEIRVAMVTDSHGGGTGRSYPGGGFPNQMARYLGWNIIPDDSSPGGTGFIAGTRPYGHATRIAALQAINPQAILVEGSQNDGGNSGAAIQAAVASYLGTVRGMFPGVPIFVMGSPGGSTSAPNQTAAIAAEVAMRTAITALADPLIFPIPVLSDPAGSWISGLGRTGAPTGSGTADLLIGGETGSDGVHLTQYGHDVIGLRAADAVMAKLPLLN